MDFPDWIPEDMQWLFTADGINRQRTQARKYTWVEDEDEILFKHYPDYERILKLLPHRTKHACINRAKKLKLQNKHWKWTEPEIKWLRKNYENADWDDMYSYLPRRSKNAICVKAHSLRLKREPQHPPPVGVYIIDEIRARARELNFSLRDLDEEAGTNFYFRQMRAKAPPTRLRIAAIESVVKAMGGQIEIRWSDE